MVFTSKDGEENIKVKAFIPLVMSLTAIAAIALQFGSGQAQPESPWQMTQMVHKHHKNNKDGC